VLEAGAQPPARAVVPLPEVAVQRCLPSAPRERVVQEVRQAPSEPVAVRAARPGQPVLLPALPESEVVGRAPVAVPQA